MSKYLIGIVGFFGNGYSTAGGQEAKTCSLTKAFKERYGADKIAIVDTKEWKKNPISLFVKSLILLKNCKNVFILPAQNGLKVFAPLFLGLNRLFRKTLHYAVVGGWLPQKTKENSKLSKQLKKFNHIYVETHSMQQNLIKQGFENVEVIPNFKFIGALQESEIKTSFSEPFRVCYFARIEQEKGIEDAIKAIEVVNEYYKKTIYQLDIYGKVEESYKQRFGEIVRELPLTIKYCGLVEPEQSVDIIKNYYALLFPTHFLTEGVPGTVIDAYYAGVPIITARWQSCCDIFTDGETGLSYNFDDFEDFVKKLVEAYEDSEKFISMRKLALKHSISFRPDTIVDKLDTFISR
jgi:glycosyltransferase involved in cell wall biosynthesis